MAKRRAHKREYRMLKLASIGGDKRALRRNLKDWRKDGAGGIKFFIGLVKEGKIAFGRLTTCGEERMQLLRGKENRPVTRESKK